MLLDSHSNAPRPEPNQLVSLKLFYLTSFVALGVYFPYFPRWLEARGIHGAAMGAIAATSPAMGLIGPVAFGLVADMLGLRGAVLRAACAGSFLTFVAITAALAFGYPLGFGALFLASLVHGLCYASTSMMTDVIAMEQSRAAGASYARVRLWGSVGFLLGALAAGLWLDPQRALPLPLVITAALFSALLAAWTLPVRAQAAPLPALAHVREALANVDFRYFLASTLLSQIAVSSYTLCFSLHLRDLGASDGHIGLAWGFGVFCEILLMAFSTPLLERFGARRLITFALLAASARWALIASVRSVPALILLQPLHAISFALWWVATMAYVKERAPARSLATTQGLFLTSTALGGILGTLASGMLYRHAGGGVTFGAAALLAAGAALVALRTGAPRGECPCEER